MRERAPLTIGENPHHAVELRAALRRKRSEPLQRRCGSFPAALELSCAQMALQALAAPGLVRAGVPDGFAIRGS